MKVIDCSGLTCPMPVVNTKKYFESIEVGSAKIIVDNEVSKSNLEKFASSKGLTCQVEEVENKFILTMEKLEGQSKVKKNEGEFSILIGTDKLGNGDDNLGDTLMKSYIYALSESENMPRRIIFLNAGVKLVSKGSSVIESLEVIVGRGVELWSCGVCLDFYNLKESLLVGEIANMYSIVEEMNTVSKLIKL